MNNKIISILIILFLTSCSPRIRYFKFKIANNKLKNDEITQDQFDEKFYRFYDINRKQNILLDTSSNLMFSGAYVEHQAANQYRVYKFFPNGKVVDIYHIMKYPDNLSLIDNNKTSYYYRLKGSEIEIEYLIIRGWHLYNIIMKGEIQNDSIIFNSRKNKSIL